MLLMEYLQHKLIKRNIMKTVLNLHQTKNNLDSLIQDFYKRVQATLTSLTTPIFRNIDSPTLISKSGISTMIMVLLIMLGNISIAQVQTEKASNHSILTRQFNMIMEKSMQLKGGNIVNKMDQENAVRDITSYLNESTTQLVVVKNMTPKFERENEAISKHIENAKEHTKELKIEIEKAIPDQEKVMSHSGKIYDEIEKAQKDHKELKMEAEK